MMMTTRTTRGDNATPGRPTAGQPAVQADVNPFVSIIIPTYNEEDDIAATLDAIVAIRYSNKEVVVVDDSTDRTPEIVQRYAEQGVRLVPGVRKATGRNANISVARNIGIRETKGEIIVFFNADNLPRPDHLDRVVPHFRRGADYVVPTTEVANQDALLARFVGALSHYCYDGQDWIEWEDGFACRRQAAIDVGMFPELPVPLYAADDATFAAKLGLRFKKVIDRSILVEHVAPASFLEYWHMRKTRGQGTPVFKFFVAGHSLARVLFRVLAGTVVFLGSVLLVAPVVVTGWRIAGKSPRGRVDTIPFAYAHSLQLVARVVGEWQSFFELCANRARNRGVQRDYVDQDVERSFRVGSRSIWRR